MNPSALEILLQEGEGTLLEYKESLSASFARELVALANTLGGKILLGVRDDGTVAGIGDSNELRARIQDIARNCDPSVKILLERVGKVAVVTVRESDAKPVQCSDGFFWRQGAVTQKLSRAEIRDFFRREGGIRFDLSLCSTFRYPRDFDRSKLDAWLDLSRITVRHPVEDILVNIEAAERSGGKLLFRHAGVLFFAREPRRFFNQAYITCILFKGTDRVHVLDRKDFDGGIVSDIEESLRFIERNTRTAYRIEKLQREEIPEYPMAALREALTNAVMHRDWFNEGANVFVEIYDNRIEIVSPGGLPAGLAASELGSRSVRRNALIADLLHRIAFIEKAGTGIRRMREDARQHDCPGPEFQADGFFAAVFRPRVEEAQAEAQVAAQAEAQDELTLVEQAILGSCLDMPRTSQELLVSTGKTRSGNFKKSLLRLLSSGLIEMILPENPRSPKQRYLLTPLGRKALGTPIREGGHSTNEAQEAQAEAQEAQAEAQEKLTLVEQAILGACLDRPQTSQGLLASMGHLTRSGNFKNSLLRLLSSGHIELTLPDKPRSPKQHYRITPLGRQVLAKS
jgi:ATP-dependent DNA helicase RecG